MFELDYLWRETLWELRPDDIDELAAIPEYVVLLSWNAGYYNIAPDTMALGPDPPVLLWGLIFNLHWKSFKTSLFPLLVVLLVPIELINRSFTCLVDVT